MESKREPNPASGPAQHTPGPWTVAENGYHVVASGIVVAGVMGSQAVRSVREECDANARLIAQAPALAQAVDMLLSVIVVDDPEAGTYTLRGRVEDALDVARSVMEAIRGN